MESGDDIHYATEVYKYIYILIVTRIFFRVFIMNSCQISKSVFQQRYCITFNTPHIYPLKLANIVSKHLRHMKNIHAKYLEFARLNVQKQHGITYSSPFEVDIIW